MLASKFSRLLIDPRVSSSSFNSALLNRIEIKQLFHERNALDQKLPSSSNVNKDFCETFQTIFKNAQKFFEGFYSPAKNNAYMARLASTVGHYDFDNGVMMATRRPTGRRDQNATSRRYQAKKDQVKNDDKPSSGSSDGKDDKDPFRMPTEEEQKQAWEQMKRLFAISLFIFGIYILMRGPDQTSDMVKETTWSEFISKLLPTGQISKVIVYPEKDIAFVYANPGARASDGTSLAPIYRMGIPNVNRFESEIRSAEAAINLPPEHWTQIEYKRLEGIASFVGLLVIFGLIAAGYFMFKKAKVSFKITDVMSTLTKAKINILDPTTKGSKLKIKFKDVAGLHEAKMEISEFVDYLKHPAKYTKLGARLPKGALLTGPPGCGKTLLAKALAAESSAPFISMNGTEFIEMIGGLGASRIRDLFKEAKSRSPCIIYIDEIDAIGRKRSESGSAMGGSSGEEEQTLNQLLVEMDGMDTTQGVILIARRFKIKKLPENLLERLAHLTPGFSGADVNNVVNEAAIRAATDHKKYVDVSDLNYAMEKVIAGPEKRSRVLVQEEKEIVAYHESGHALVGWLLEHTDALLKVTIVPRTSAALGFAQYTPRDRKLFSREELFDRMCMMLGGRCAENVKFGRKYGMSDLVGPISFATNPADERAAQFYKKPYSKKFGQIMDEEVRKLVGRAYFFTEQLLRDNEDKLEKIAKALLERESLSYEDVKQLIGPPKYGEKSVVDIVDQILPKDEDE
ncbi:Peptidase M41 and ATPase domain containing protein [Aphelenchoides bicaudatus]|nr:Peptidase M41 and ATPase domain containing protein [Aphelenchoides bicaudatus]